LIKKKKISEGIRRYYGSLEWKKRKEERQKTTFDKILGILDTENFKSTREICNEYNKQSQKEITLRRMSQLLFQLLAKKRLCTEIKNNGNKGRFRVWKRKN